MSVDELYVQSFYWKGVLETLAAEPGLSLLHAIGCWFFLIFQHSSAHVWFVHLRSFMMYHDVSANHHKSLQ
jgi:hypothetical protein